MNLMVLLLVMALASPSVYAETHKKKQVKGFNKFLKTLFEPRTKNKAQVVRTKTKPKSKPKPTPGPQSLTHVVVDENWITKYRKQEQEWKYPIPDDEQIIKVQDGKYHVPRVVFKHYEDMLNTPPRSPTPKPNDYYRSGYE